MGGGGPAVDLVGGEVDRVSQLGGEVGEQLLRAVGAVVHRALGDARGVDDAVERGIVEAVGGELVRGGAQDRLLLGGRELRDTRADDVIEGCSGDRQGAPRRCRARPLTRSGLRGIPRSRISVFLTASWTRLRGANASSSRHEP
jgi:hypothetical protein